MAGVKISELPAATTPLAGTELLAIVQGGVTKQASADAVSDTVLDEFAASSGSSLVGFLQSGTGAQIRTVQSKLRDVVSVRDFGAVGDGVADDYSAFNAAISAVSAAGGGLIRVPDGTYLVSQAIPFASNVGLIGDGFDTIIKAHPSSTDNVIGTAMPAAAVNNCLLAYMTIDGNKSAVAYNTRVGGLTDDAYQNGIRLNQVSNSRFVGVRVYNSVMNGWSIYNASNDNVFEDCWSLDSGKNSIPAGGVYSWNGFFLEFGVNRNKLVRPYVNTCGQIGIWETTNGADNYDNEIIDALVLNPGTDGISYYSTIGPNTTWRPKLINPKVVNASGVGAVGIRLFGYASAAGPVSDALVANPQVYSCTNGILTQNFVRRARIIGAQVYGCTNAGLSVGVDSVDTVISGQALSNGSNWYDGGTRTTSLGLQVDTSGATYFPNQILTSNDLKISKGSGNTTQVLLDQSGVVQWYVKNVATTGSFAIGSGGAGDVINSTSGGNLVVGASGKNLGFYGTTPVAKPSVTGAKGGNAALTSLMTQLAALGLVTDSTT